MSKELMNFLGLTRRANKISLGHDASVNSIKHGDAKLCMLASDASDRLKGEFSKLCQKHQIKLIEMSETMDDIWRHVGVKVGAVTVNDSNFSHKIESMSGFNDREEFII